MERYLLRPELLDGDSAALPGSVRLSDIQKTIRGSVHVDCIIGVLFYLHFFAKVEGMSVDHRLEQVEGQAFPHRSKNQVAAVQMRVIPQS